MIKPVGRRVLVKRVEEGEEKKGGIIIPDTAKEKPQQGIVEAVAEVSKDDDPMPVKKGDRILFGKYGGTEIEYNEEEYLILEEDDILAKIE
ncbi:co-chaperone GroES [candidate division WOR-3 bacterium]|nr:co-chaperone GroES [candidate division WOR-3 bacterium]MCK4571613.1 co-chaperone GroES [candidate division WOR-3 bacterium]